MTDVFVDGSAYLNEKLLNKTELESYFREADNEEEFVKKLYNLNGFFKVTANDGETVYAAVDRLRSMPVFYDKSGKVYHFSDIDLNSQKIDSYRCAQYSMLGFVPEKYTLFQNLYEIEAGCYIKSAGGSVKQTEYYSYRHGNYIKSRQEALNKLETVYDRVFKRVAESLKGRQIVLPLSGGQDSRLIAHMLHKYGYRNVLCYSYGKAGNAETAVSKEVARRLGYKWTFIEYSDAFLEEFKEGGQLYQDILFLSSYSCQPHLQDYFAVYELKRKGLLSDNCVFMPGHSGDFVAGSHIPATIMYHKGNSVRAAADEIAERYYGLRTVWPEGLDRSVIQLEMRKEFISMANGKSDRETAADLLEWWDWKERQCKLIVNSVRVYELFGYSWAIPLWDNEIMEFWRRIPIKMRYTRSLYFEYACNQMPQFRDYLARERVKSSFIKNIRHQFAGFSAVNKITTTQYLKRAAKTDVYNTHPLNWFKIIDYDYYLNLKKKYGFVSFSSYLTELLLDQLRKSQVETETKIKLES